MSIRSRIKCINPNDGEYVLFDTWDSDSEISEAKHSDAINDRIFEGKLDMTLLPEHPFIEKVKDRVSTIVVEEATNTSGTLLEEIFHGRVISSEYDIYHKFRVSCEADIKFLEDVPDIFSMENVADNVEQINFTTAMAKIFFSHGAQDADSTGYNKYASPDRRIYLGSIDSSFNNKKIDKPSSGSSIFSNLKTWLEAVEGYAKIVKVITGSTAYYRLDILADTGDQNDDFVVKFGENVTDYKLQKGTETFYTAIHAVGNNGQSKVTPSAPLATSGYELDNLDNCLIKHKDSVAQYGLIFYHEEFSKDGSTALTHDAVRDKAIESLKKKMKRFESLEVSVVDPRLIKYESSNGGRLGDKYMMDIPLYRMLYPSDYPSPGKYEPLTKIDRDLIDPKNGKLTFGDKRDTISGRSTAAMNKANTATKVAIIARNTANSAATPAMVAQAIADSEARYNDYIIDSGTIITDGNTWYYRKWSNGLVEFWANGVTVSLSAFSDWTAELKYATGSLTFPFTMQSTETTNVQVQVAKTGSTEVNGIALIAIKSTTGIKIRFVRKASVANVYLDVFASGYEQQ